MCFWTLAQARLLVAAIPDALAVRAVVAYARCVNPALNIVVRTHSQAEHEFLARYGVTESVLGELSVPAEHLRGGSESGGVGSCRAGALARGRPAWWRVVPYGGISRAATAIRHPRRRLGAGCCLFEGGLL
jgi:hypothetical protein